MKIRILLLSLIAAFVSQAQDSIGVILPDNLGNLLLDANHAQLHGGGGIGLAKSQGTDVIGGWASGGDWASWKVRFPAPGTYLLTANVADPKANTEFDVTVGGEKFCAKSTVRGGWNDYSNVALAKIRIDRPGELTVAMGAHDAKAWNPINLLSLRLTKINSGGSSGVAAVAPIWPADETVDAWNGYKRHHFKVDGCDAWVVEPRSPLAGNPWVWCLEFADRQEVVDRCAIPQLVMAGYYFAHIRVGNTFGSPPAIHHFDAFYKELTARKLADKVVLVGISRGGLYAYRWASKNPSRIAVIYGDAPVCDIKSWPAGKGQGSGSPGDWSSLLACYGFKDEAEALAYRGNPIDTLAGLAKEKIPLIHVVGDADTLVPVAENTAIVEESYNKMGGLIRVIHKPSVGHLHGLDDRTPVVEFILQHTRDAAASKPN
jgi:pimeloyl-ACP methyl ester carboxylesterase